ncbi:VanZ family protein [Terrimonas rubra]|uniref:VanZ family protein n=1 Tax=Terrimonas rubra TaxID=1035890 RepID=A0ABW6A4Q0_9BACT
MKHLLQKAGWVLFIINMAVLCRFILFKNEPGTFRVQHQANNKRQMGMNTTPFASVKKIYYSNKSATYKFKNIAGNVLGFMPLGFLLPFLVFRRWGIILSIFAATFLSMGFEYIQLYTGCGVFDVDDIILNALGGIIGALFYGICQLARYLLSKKREINTVHFTQLATHQ